MRMLGTGRPFVLELHNARNPDPGQAALDAAAAALQAADVGVQAQGLRLVGREMLLRLKASVLKRKQSGCRDVRCCGHDSGFLYMSMQQLPMSMHSD